MNQAAPPDDSSNWALFLETRAPRFPERLEQHLQRLRARVGEGGLQSMEALWAELGSEFTVRAYLEEGHPRTFEELKALVGSLSADRRPTPAGCAALFLLTSGLGLGLDAWLRTGGVFAFLGTLLGLGVSLYVRARAKEGLAYFRRMVALERLRPDSTGSGRAELRLDAAEPPI